MYDPGKLYVDPILTQFSVGYEDQQLFGSVCSPLLRLVHRQDGIVSMTVLTGSCSPLVVSRVLWRTRFVGVSGQRITSAL